MAVPYALGGKFLKKKHGKAVHAPKVVAKKMATGLKFTPPGMDAENAAEEKSPKEEKE